MSYSNNTPINSKMSYLQEDLKNLALKSPQKKQYGCIITFRGKVIATGYNYDTGNCSLNRQCLL